MSRKSKAIFGVILATVALVVVSATAAYAAGPTVHLQLDRTRARYGDDFVIQPSVEGTQVVPGDTVTLEALGVDGIWSTYGEGMKVEDTGTIDPQTANVDGSFLPWFTSSWQPIKFRATYKSNRFKTIETPEASSTPIPFSSVEQPSMQIMRFGRPVLSRKVPAKVTHDKRFTVTAQTVPWVGEGTLRVRILKSNGRLYSQFTTTTDDSGYGSLRAKVARIGTYKVEVTWLGNAFAPMSKPYTSTLRVQ